MTTLTFQIPDERDRDFLLNLLRRLGIAISEQVAQPDQKPKRNTFFQNAQGHAVEPVGEDKPHLSSDIDRILYGGCE